METVITERSTENMAYVRRLLRQKQPGFSAALELAVLAEQELGRRRCSGWVRCCRTPRCSAPSSPSSPTSLASRLVGNAAAVIMISSGAEADYARDAM